jgi:peroxiredoxin Q/BCP
MQDDVQRFEKLNATVVVVAHHSAKEMQAYWKKHGLSYRAVPDPEGRLANLYDQQWRLLKLGRMPALFIVAPDGSLAYTQYGQSMSDIPKNETLFEVLRRLEAGAGTLP